ncbi:MAG: hypothetical protein ABIV21_07975, partial [Pyrinomonadaceae bacterium]
YITDANGKRVGVIVPIEVWEEIESGPLRDRIDELKRLFKKTQSFPSVQSVSEDDVSNEIKLSKKPKSKKKRKLGIWEGKVKYIFADNFKMTDEELLNS